MPDSSVYKDKNDLKPDKTANNNSSFPADVFSTLKFNLFSDSEIKN